jgi:hypothetical protein
MICGKGMYSIPFFSFRIELGDRLEAITLLKNDLELKCQSYLKQIQAWSIHSYYFQNIITQFAGSTRRSRICYQTIATTHSFVARRAQSTKSTL